MKEADLYAPVKRFLEAQGYEVKGEVKGCDVVAVRGDEPPVVVELKVNFTLQLVLQGVERAAVSDAVYLAVPEGTAALRKQRKRVLKLLRRLGFGLLTVSVPHDRVGVLLDPRPYAPKVIAKRQQRLLGEFHRRVGDPNAGGSTGRGGLLTAYRQRALAIAGHLALEGPTKASVVAKAVNDPKARELLYRDVYGWFEREGRGVYRLSPRGEAERAAWTTPTPGESDSTG